MTREEHLLTIAIEECNETAQRLSKALRFGMEEIQQDQPLTNRQRIYAEYYELRAVLGMCGIDAWDTRDVARKAENDKCNKVEKYLQYSSECGTLK